MKFIKCPRCELNYIREEEGYCPVCKREMKGERQEEVELCSICNENPVMPGRDICIECFKEMSQQRSQSEGDSESDEEVEINMDEVTQMEDVAEMDEIDIDDDEDDVPGGMGSQISLEEEQSKELDDDPDEADDRFEDN